MKIHKHFYLMAGIIIFIAALMFIPNSNADLSTSASYTYDSLNKIYSLKDHAGLTSLADVKLISNTPECSDNCNFEINIKPYTSFTINESMFNLEFFDNNNNLKPVSLGATLKDYSYYIQNGTYKEKVDNWVNCSYLDNITGKPIIYYACINGTKEIDAPLYSKFDFFNYKITKEENIKVTGSKDSKASLEWVLTFLGVKLNNWLTWGASDLKLGQNWTGGDQQIVGSADVYNTGDKTHINISGTSITSSNMYLAQVTFYGYAWISHTGNVYAGLCKTYACTDGTLINSSTVLIDGTNYPTYSYIQFNFTNAYLLNESQNYYAIFYTPTSVGGVWYVDYNYGGAADSLLRGEWWYIEGALPNTPPIAYKPVWVNTSITYTTDNLKCMVNTSDAENGYINTTFLFYNNSINVYNVSNTSNLNNNATFSAMLPENYSGHFDNLTCMVKAYDGLNYSAINISNNLTVSNFPPSVPETLLPEDLATYTYNNPNVTFRYSSSSYNPDGDLITYYLFLNDTFNLSTNNNAGFLYSMPTVNFSTFGSYRWKVKAGDGYENTSFTTSRTFYIDNPSIVTKPIWVNTSAVYGNTSASCSTETYDIENTGRKILWASYVNGSYAEGYINNTLIYNENNKSTYTFSSNFYTNFDNISCFARIYTDITENYSYSDNITVSNYAPTTPILISPEDNYLSKTLNITFQYSAFDEDNDVLTYHLYIDGTLNASYSGNITFNFTGNGTYLWSITADDGYINSSFTENRTLTIDTTDYPALLCLYSPTPYIKSTISWLCTVENSSVSTWDCLSYAYYDGNLIQSNPNIKYINGIGSYNSFRAKPERNTTQNINILFDNVNLRDNKNVTFKAICSNGTYNLNFERNVTPSYKDPYELIDYTGIFLVKEGNINYIVGAVILSIFIIAGIVLVVRIGTGENR